MALDNLQAIVLRVPGTARDQLTAAFEDLYAASATGLAATSPGGHRGERLLRSLNPAGYEPANGGTYSPGPLGRSLRHVARLIKADLGVEIALAQVLDEGAESPAGLRQPQGQRDREVLAVRAGSRQ